MHRFTLKWLACIFLVVIVGVATVSCMEPNSPLPSREELLLNLFGPPSEAYLANKPPKGWSSVKDAKAALNAEPNNRWFKVQLSFALYTEGKLGEAARAFEQYSYKNPELEADRLRFLAVCREYLGDYKRAAESYALASDLVSKDKNAGELKFVAGLNYLRLGNHSEADKLLEEAVRRDKANGFAVLAQFASAFDQKEWRKAGKVLEHGKEFDQPKFAIRFKRANQFLTQVAQ